MLNYSNSYSLRPSCAACVYRSFLNVIIQVDHVKARSKFPRLALNPKNLQILCKACNLGKSNLYKDDWRPKDWKTMIRVFLNIKA
ncbi:HNH endonuclease [Dyadobacter tibetensis]|uniref:HNH endonuclease n=1 Tax=Dyadobacter tibetensis TaxID=1211851 RepID=UPI0035B67CE9